MNTRAESKKSVVIIDDDIIQLLLLERFLEGADYKISKFTGAREALESLDKSNPPDIIITDLFMPHIDGWRLCRLLRSTEYQAFNTVPILVVSATFSGDDAAKITDDTGANAFLPMPVDKDILLSTVEAMLSNDCFAARQNVLIVEDSKSLTTILKSAFETNGYDVCVALTADQARQAFAAGQFDFVVIDYHLPDDNGDRLLSEFHTEKPDSVIIMITTDTNPDFALNWLHDGASAYLRKPFAPEYLVELCAKSGREKSLLRVERLLEEKSKQLRESDQRWQYALEGVEDGLWDWNVQTNEVYYSSLWKEMLGYGGDEIGTGLDEWDSKLHPDDKEETYEKLDRHLKGETPFYRSEHRILCKDGTWKWVLDRGRVIEWTEDGNPLRIIGTHTDITERKQAETGRIEAHLRLTTVLNSIDAFIYVADMQTHELLFVNDYGKRIWGNIEGQKCWKVIQSGQPGPCAFCTNDKLLDADGKPAGVYHWEFKNLKNGRWYDCRDSAIRWIDGRMVRFEIALDIQDRKAAEAALKAANAKLEALWDISSLADADFNTICDHVLATIVRMTNSCYGFYGFINPDASVMTIYAWSGEAMKGCRMVNQPQQFPVSEAGLWAEAVRKRKPMMFNSYAEDHPAKKGYPEGHVELKNLLVVPFMAHKRIVTVAAVANREENYTLDDVSQITSFLTGIQAVTERMEAELELLKSKKQLALTTDNFPGLVSILDAGFRFIYASDGFERLLGIAAEEVIGKSLKDVIGWKNYDTAEVHLKTAMSEKRIVTYENASKLPSGKFIQGFNTIVPDVDAEGAVSQFYVFGVDITDRKRLEEERLEMERQLLHSQKLESLGVLAGGIAHDFNNLLMAIIGNLDMSLLEISPVSAARSRIENAMKASHRAADLTRQMLAYSGRGHFIIRDIDINELIKENVHIFRSSVLRTAGFQMNLSPDIPFVAADAGQVQQIVMNLITNASEAVGETGGNITLSTGVMDCDDAFLSKSCVEEKPAAGRYVFIEVSDTGCGMDVQTQERLFEPFFSTKFTGRGLGMAAVIGIVRGHKGAILVDSKPDRGTTIRVLFPQSEKKQETVKVNPAADSVEKQCGQTDANAVKTVLIVDDEESVLDMCSEMVVKFGYRTVTAQNGLEAVEKYRELSDEIDCVILDLSMPKMSGHATFLELKKINPDVKVILSSGYNKTEATARFEGEGLSGFIQKPFAMKTLRGDLEKLLR